MPHASKEHYVSYEVDARGVAWVTLDRDDKRNAFDNAMIAALTQAFDDAESNDEVKLLVLQSVGKQFSAGADLAWMQSMVDYSFDENLADAHSLATMLAKLNGLSKPSIARVQGAAYGGAVGLISCCDIAVASQAARFCLSEVKLGLVPATIAPFVIAAIGARAARRYFQSAETFDAQQALQLNLLSNVVAATQLDAHIEAHIARLLNNGSEAMKAAKQLVAHIDNTQDQTALTRHTCEVIARARVSAEGQARLRAFLHSQGTTEKS